MEVPAHSGPSSLGPDDSAAHRRPATPSWMAEKCVHCKPDKCVRWARCSRAARLRGHSDNPSGTHLESIRRKLRVLYSESGI